MTTEHGRTDAGPAPARTMTSVVQDAYGEDDVLRLAEIARPEVGRGDVLVRVRAASVDRGTWHLMAGPTQPGWRSVSAVRVFPTRAAASRERSSPSGTA